MVKICLPVCRTETSQETDTSWDEEKERAQPRRSGRGDLFEEQIRKIELQG